MLSANLLSTSTAATLLVPFDQINRVYVEYQVAGAICFRADDEREKVPGATVTYRLIGNGFDVPQFQGFKEMSGSAGYDGRVGAINVIQCFFDGVDCWYSIFHAKNLPASTYPVVLQFLARTDGIIQTGSVYQAVTGGPFEQYMISAQSIPENKDGQVTCLVDEQILLGLTESPELQPYPAWQYRVWAAVDSYYSSTLGTDYIDSKVPYVGRSYLRIARKSGVVSCEVSADNRTWNLIRVFPQASSAALYVAVALTAANPEPKTMTLVACEVGV